jgi:tRNA (adenine-N(1)-)-methyltransferase non-catalytic subunit
LGKFGTFNSNLIIGRPYYLTYELLDKDDGRSRTELRVVPAAELHAEALGEEHAPAAEAADEVPESGAGFDIVGEDGEVIMRNNRLTVDDASRQKLSMDEIEALKKAGTGSGKDIIAKIMASHNAIGEKTTFSLAKYTLRKSRKYLKRFTALPMDVGVLTEYVLEKEAYKIMELWCHKPGPDSRRWSQPGRWGPVASSGRHWWPCDGCTGRENGSAIRRGR